MFGDVYNPLAGPCKGNSNCEKGLEMRSIRQASENDGWIDLRLFYHQHDPIDFTFCRFNDPKMYTKWFYTSYSWFSGPNGSELPLCYTTESWKLA